MLLEGPQVMPSVASQSDLLLGDVRPTRADDSQPDGATAAFPLEISPTPSATALPPTDPVPELRPADPETAPAATARHPLHRSGSILLAAGAHVLALLALVSAPPTEFGYGGQSIDAVSVSIVPASAITARQSPAETAADAAPSNVAPNQGDDSATSQAAQEKSAPPEEKKAEPSAEPDKLDLALAAPEQPALQAAPDAAPEITKPSATTPEVDVAAVERPPAPQLPEPPKEKSNEPPAPSSPAATAGGSQAQGTAEVDQPAQAGAAASAGEIHAYGLALQSALLAVDQAEAKARVSASKAKGTVVVLMTIGDSGAVMRVEVVQSSGQAHLDDAALLLIRMAAFPPPPRGLPPEQRSYTAPIRFQ